MTPPKPLEAAAFLTLLAVSVVLFWRRVRRVLGIIFDSKPDPGFALQPLRPRIRELGREVLLQARVIRERPWPGIAHALVFWGFCVFALVSLNHLSLGVGVELFTWREGFFGPLYFFVAALFAVAVAVSITALAIRRFVTRPKWLGEVSPESGIIAFLIFALMLTYLADYVFEPQGGAYRLVWWLHTLALLAFLPLIPHTKHLHLVLSPASVLLSRGGFSRIPPLAGDDDFGLSAGKDVTRIVSLQSFSCVECGRCTEHCPASNTGKLLSPKQVILGFRDYLNEFGPHSEEPLFGKHLAMEAAFQCTTCGACEYQCPVGVEHLPIIVGLRRGAVNTGAWDDEYGTRLFLNLERNGNPLGFPPAERGKFIQKLGLPSFDGSQEYCLWLGCMGAYDPQGREIVAALAAVLRYLNVSFGVLRQEKCSGDAARRLGNDLLFQTLAEANAGELRSSGARKLLAVCPHCVRTLGEDYKEFGVPIEIEHHSSFLARHAASFPAARNGRRIVLHDPCYLGRYQGRYDEPRIAARLGGSLVEPRRARERSFCCGAGGGLVFLGEEKGKRVSVERAEELMSTGADVVAAACPFCNTMFRDALASASPSPPQLLDIAQIAAAALTRRV